MPDNKKKKTTPVKRKKHKVKKFFKKFWEVLIQIGNWLILLWEKLKKKFKDTKLTAGFIIFVLVIMGTGFDCGYTKKRGFYCNARWAAPDPEDVNKIIRLDDK